MSGGGGLTDQGIPGSSLRPYLKRKKSSFIETKVAMVGPHGVGKSALSVRFLTKRFIGEYDKTTESKYKYTTTIDGETVIFEVLDTLSDNDDCGVREDVLRWADCIILVYSVVSRKSFDMLPELKKNIDENRKGSNIPMILIGNKRDLAHMREVTTEEGEKQAAELGCPFFEVSASEEVDTVTEAFHKVSREVVDFKRRSRTFIDKVFGAFGLEKTTS